LILQSLNEVDKEKPIQQILITLTFLNKFSTSFFSLDSGRASNSNSNSNSTTDSSFHSIHPIREHPYPVRGNSLGLPPPVSQMGRMSSIGSVGSSFRQSYHSSSSSLGSVERAEDSICALDIQEMTADGVPVSQQKLFLITFDLSSWVLSSLP